MEELAIRKKGIEEWIGLLKLAGIAKVATHLYIVIIIQKTKQKNKAKHLQEQKEHFCGFRIFINLKITLKNTEEDYLNRKMIELKSYVYSLNKIQWNDCFTANACCISS